MLEQKIDELKMAIIGLTAAIAAQGGVAAAPPAVKAPKQVAPVATAPVAEAPQAAPATTPAPATAAVLTIDEVRARLAKVIETQGPTIVPPALAALGVKQLSQLDPAQYEALLASVGA